MTGRIIICSLLFSLHAAGQEQEVIDSVRPQESAPTTFMGRLHQVQQYLDNKARSSVDPHYIEVPDKPWRVILRYKETAVDVNYDNSLVEPGSQNRVDFNMRFQPPASASIGFWVGYRGTGISYSYSLAKNAGRYFSFSSTGAKYGINFRLRRFNTDEVSASFKIIENGDVTKSLESSGHMPAPVWIRSAYLNAYYVFNGRRYSQAAAYNQSVIQRRSAGSFLAGATWYQSSFDNSDLANRLLLFYCNNEKRIKIHQANIGFGYGYNLVPLRGLVINAMVMPTLSVYNRVKVERYDSNYSLTEGTGEIDDYGEWNKQTHTWANGKTQKPLGLEKGTDWTDKYDLWGGDSETNYGRIQFNVDVRLGLAYNWKNFFIGAQAQFNRFSYKKGECKVVLIDGYARLALGVRL
jgi:hypothetical protein